MATNRKTQAGSNERRDFGLSGTGERLARHLNTPGSIPVFDKECNLIDLIMPPPNPELTTYRSWYQEVVDQAIAEDLMNEGQAHNVG